MGSGLISESWICFLFNSVIEGHDILAGKLEGSGVTFLSNSQVTEQGGMSTRRWKAGK